MDRDDNMLLGESVYSLIKAQNEINSFLKVPAQEDNELRSYSQHLNSLSNSCMKVMMNNDYIKPVGRLDFDYLPPTSVFCLGNHLYESEAVIMSLQSLGSGDGFCTATMDTDYKDTLSLKSALDNIKNFLADKSLKMDEYTRNNIDKTMTFLDNHVSVQENIIFLMITKEAIYHLEILKERVSRSD